MSAPGAAMEKSSPSLPAMLPPAALPAILSVVVLAGLAVSALPPLSLDHRLERTQLIPEATRDNVEWVLVNTTLVHPYRGAFTITLEPDPSPVVTRSCSGTDEREAVCEVPRSFVLHAWRLNGVGYLVAFNEGLAGRLDADYGDVDMEGEWVEDGLLLKMDSYNPLRPYLCRIAACPGTSEIASED